MRRRMKVLVTCDSYKDCLTAIEVGESIISGIESMRNDWKIIHIPNADGGEGSLSALANMEYLERVYCNTLDPMLRGIESYYLVDRHQLIAYIEMATTSGIELLSVSERNGLYTSTYGTGVMISDAISKGFKHIVFFIGGSATSEMGIGMANGLGVKFYDRKGSQINKPRGIDLKEIVSAQIPEYLRDIKMSLICDVENPLYGPEGAAYMYGPQKGCDSNAILLLDKGMRSLNQILNQHYNIDYAFEKGAGAAGGIGKVKND